MSKRSGNLAITGLIMAGVGYLLGILTAPKSGKETRKDIQRSAIKAKTDAEKKLKSVHKELNELVDRGTEQAKKLQTRAKGELDKAVNSAAQARDRAREMLSSLHEGESDDKDLDRAIKDANQAIANLRRYIDKHAPAQKKGR